MDLIRRYLKVMMFLLFLIHRLIKIQIDILVRIIHFADAGNQLVAKFG